MRRKQRLRGQAAATWTAVNPILGKYEPGYESDTDQLKIGDGSTAWNLLPYFGGGSGAGSTTVEYDPVISVLNAPPAHVLGDRYLVGTAPTGAWTGPSRANNIAESDGAAWTYTVPATGDKVFVTATLTTKRFNGTAWVNWVGTAILNNGNTLGANMSIGTNDTRALIFKTNGSSKAQFTSAGVFNVSGNTFIGHFSTAPTARLHVRGAGATSATYALKVDNSTPLNILGVRNDGHFKVTSTIESQGSGNPIVEIESSTGGTRTFFNAQAGFANILQFVTAGSEKARIYASPSSELLVYSGLIALYSNMSDRNFLMESSGNTIMGDTGGAYSASAKLHVLGAGATSATNIFKASNNSNVDKFIVRGDGASYFISAIEGDGTGNPMLTVRSSAGGVRQFIEAASTYSGWIEFYDGASLNARIQVAPSSNMYVFSNSYYLRNLAGTVQFYKTTAGDFKLGDSTGTVPEARLHLMGEAATSATKVFRADNSASSQLFSINNAGGIAMPLVQVGNAALASGDLYFDTAANITDNGDKFCARKV